MYCIFVLFVIFIGFMNSFAWFDVLFLQSVAIAWTASGTRNCGSITWSWSIWWPISQRHRQMTKKRCEQSKTSFKKLGWKGELLRPLNFSVGTHRIKKENLTLNSRRHGLLSCKGLFIRASINVIKSIVVIGVYFWIVMWRKKKTADDWDVMLLSWFEMFGSFLLMNCKWFCLVFFLWLSSFLFLCFPGKCFLYMFVPRWFDSVFFVDQWSVKWRLRLAVKDSSGQESSQTSVR